METFELLIIGLSAGFLGGMLGIGGSLIMIPAMTVVLGPNQHLYQATAMIVNVFVAFPAMVQHARAGAVDRRIVWRLIPIAIAAVIGGVLLSELPLFDGSGEVHLRQLFATFLFAISGYDIYRLLRGRRDPPPNTVDNASTDTDNASTQTRASWRFAAAVALPTGLIAGLLGIGGGVMAVPLQRRFLSVPMRNAIANSSTLIVATAAVGATLKNLAYAAENSTTPDAWHLAPWHFEPFYLAAILIPTAVGGSFLGSRLTHRLPLRFIKILFLILMLAAAARMIRT